MVLGLAASLLLAGAPSVHDASATGETRILSFHHVHSKESLTITYKRNGRYDEAALKTLNHFLRDWRSQEQTRMDPHLFDILWEVYRDVDAKQPINIISSYRSPATNAMLRRRSANSGVARSSQHTLGRAMDFFIPGVPLEKIRFAGLRLQRGGVGFYPTSGSPFVHLDTGSIRHWPRMTHDQLVRVFPNGRTVHVPSNGKPLPGYQLALADIERRKHDDTNSAKVPNLLASLFGGKASSQDETPAPAATAAANRAAAEIKIASAGGAKDAGAAPVSLATSAAARLTEIVPLPRAKPADAAPYQVAAAAPRETALKPQPVRSQAVPQSETRRPQTPADIINMRAFWDDDFKSPTPASQAQIAALRARHAADPQSTASLPEKISEAMAYAPAAAADSAEIETANAPLAADIRLASATRPTANTARTGDHREKNRHARLARLILSNQSNNAWLRAMILAPDVSSGLSSTILGDQDLTAMSAHFVKPNHAVTMTFSDDPQMGLICPRFTGVAVADLAVTSFNHRTAALR